MMIRYLQRSLKTLCQLEQREVGVHCNFVNLECNKRSEMVKNSPPEKLFPTT
jgi:hypothetical protein